MTLIDSSYRSTCFLLILLLLLPLVRSCCENVKMCQSRAIYKIIIILLKANVRQQSMLKCLRLLWHTQMISFQLIWSNKMYGHAVSRTLCPDYNPLPIHIYYAIDDSWGIVLSVRSLFHHRIIQHTRHICIYVYTCRTYVRFNCCGISFCGCHINLSKIRTPINLQRYVMPCARDVDNSPALHTFLCVQSIEIRNPHEDFLGCNCRCRWIQC